MSATGRALAWLKALPGIPPEPDRKTDREWIPPFKDSLSQLAQYVQDHAKDSDPNLLEAALANDAGGAGLEWAFYWDLAASGILLRGPTGVDRLLDLIHAPAGISSNTIIEMLWKAASGAKLGASGDLSEHLPPIEISPETADRARIAIDDLIVDSSINPDIFSKLINFVSVDAIRARHHTDYGFASHFMRVSSESSIALTHRVLDEFADMVQRDLPEETYQSFLKRYPVLLDPLSAEILPKHKLGTELVTDFVIRRHDFRYVAVEIEKPQEDLFTRSNDFTAQFTHAFGQVIDFQRWIASNVAYARTNLPSVDSPHGLLIMGRRSALTDEQQHKLRWWQTNSKSVELATFDDLVERGRLLLKSLRRDTSEREPEAGSTAQLAPPAITAGLD